MIQNYWISPRGEEHLVPNHTSWLEQAFKTKLPPMDDVEHEIEKNKLYDWAYRMNWMRAQLDYGRRALYVDPDPQTGDHWRWLARQGHRNHLLIYNSDGKELGNFQPGKHKKQQEALITRLQLGLGPEAYIREVLDIKQFIMDQPDLFTYKYGERIWAVAARKPVPKGAEFKHHLSYAEVLAFIHEQPDGTYRLANFCPDNRLNSRFLRMDDMRRKRWATREAAANDIWAFSQRLKVESEPPSVKDYIMNLDPPRARDVEYVVKAIWQVQDTRIYRGYKILEEAYLFGLNLLHATYRPLEIRIQKVYKPSNTVLFQYELTDGGCLRPMDLTEALDAKKELLNLLVPEEALANLGFKPGSSGGYTKGPFPLAASLVTKRESGDSYGVWSSTQTWTSVTLLVYTANMGWDLYFVLNGKEEVSGSVAGPVRPVKRELQGFAIYAIPHWDAGKHTDLSDKEWPISGGMDFSTPLMAAVKLVEAEIPNISQQMMTVGGWEDFRQSLIKRLEAALPKSYPKPQQEGLDAKHFIMKQPPLLFIPDMSRPGRIILYLDETSFAPPGAVGTCRGIAYLRAMSDGAIRLELLLGNGGSVFGQLKNKRWKSQEEAAAEIWDALVKAGLEKPVGV